MKNVSTATNSAEPATDHTTGNATPPTLTVKISGSFSQRESAKPSSAPMKPTAIDPKQPLRKDWKAVIQEHPSDVLGGFEAIGGQILVSYLSRAVSRIERFDRSGKSLGPVELPMLGSND